MKMEIVHTEFVRYSENSADRKMSIAWIRMLEERKVSVDGLCSYLKNREKSEQNKTKASKQKSAKLKKVKEIHETEGWLVANNLKWHICRKKDKKENRHQPLSIRSKTGFHQRPCRHQKDREENYNCHKHQLRWNGPIPQKAQTASIYPMKYVTESRKWT